MIASTVPAMADEEAEFEILSEEGETPDEHDLQILETLEEHGVVRHFHAGHGPGRYVLVGGGTLWMPAFSTLAA